MSLVPKQRIYLFCPETDLKSAAISSDKQNIENSTLFWSFMCFISSSTGTLYASACCFPPASEVLTTLPGQSCSYQQGGFLCLSSPLCHVWSRCAVYKHWRLRLISLSQSLFGHELWDLKVFETRRTLWL